MLRFVFLFLAIVILVPVIRGVLGTLMKMLMRWAGAGTNNATRAPSGPPPAPAASTLRRDPVCGAYVSEDIAVTLRSGSGTVYFCSSACRDKYDGHAS